MKNAAVRINSVNISTALLEERAVLYKIPLRSQIRRGGPETNWKSLYINILCALGVLCDEMLFKQIHFY